MPEEQQKKIRKQPERRCVGCGQSFPKKELLRVVRGTDGSITLDRTGKKSGRGAYLCGNIGCMKKARKAKRLESNLSCPIPEEVYRQLEAELEKDATG